MAVIEGLHRNVISCDLARLGVSRGEVAFGYAWKQRAMTASKRGQCTLTRPVWRWFFIEGSLSSPKWKGGELAKVRKDKNQKPTATPQHVPEVTWHQQVYDKSTTSLQQIYNISTKSTSPQQVVNKFTTNRSNEVCAKSWRLWGIYMEQ